MARTKLCRMLSALAATALVSAFAGNGAADDPSVSPPKKVMKSQVIDPAPRAPAQEIRQSARDLGIVVGILPPGPLNAITDVAGVLVGQVTISRGNSINTGVTVILPHGGNVFQQKVPAAVVVGNGFGNSQASHRCRN